MSNTKEKYDEIVKQRRKNSEEMEMLEKDDKVKRYLELQKLNTTLYYQQEQVYSALKNQEYKKCRHVVVYTKDNYDEHESRNNLYCGCIKCGLDERVLEDQYEYLSLSKKCMYNYLTKHSLVDNINTINTGIKCDLELAQSIYSKFKEEHPNIDDEEVKYFLEDELDKEKQHDGKTKKLVLNKNYNK